LSFFFFKINYKTPPQSRKLNIFPQPPPPPTHSNHNGHHSPPKSHAPLHIFHYTNVLYRFIKTQTNENSVNLRRLFLHEHADVDFFFADVTVHYYIQFFRDNNESSICVRIKYSQVISCSVYITLSSSVYSHVENSYCNWRKLQNDDFVYT